MMKLLDRTVTILSIAAGLGLLGACTAPFSDPDIFVLPSLLGLAYPYLLPANVLLALYWLLRRKKKFWFCLALLLAAVPSFITYFGFSGLGKSREKADISLLSYNVRYFDRLNWTGRKDTRNRLISYLNRFQGDIICLQEFAMQRNPEKAREITGRLKTYPYHYIYREMAIFSRLPILSKGRLPFDPHHSGRGIWCRFLLDKDTVCLYNVHLESYRLGTKEKGMLKDLNTDKGQLSEATRHIGRRLVEANRRRSSQIGILDRHIAANPHKVILCGDLNDTPISYTYRKLTTRLKDCFTEKGRGLGNTYIGELPFLRFRLDYIMHSPGFRTLSYNRGRERLSDHHPIQARLVSDW